MWKCSCSYTSKKTSVRVEFSLLITACLKHIHSLLSNCMTIKEFAFSSSDPGHLNSYSSYHYLLVLWICKRRHMAVQRVLCSGKGHGIISEMVSIIFQPNKWCTLAVLLFWCPYLSVSVRRWKYRAWTQCQQRREDQMIMIQPVHRIEGFCIPSCRPSVSPNYLQLVYPLRILKKSQFKGILKLFTI